MGEGSDLSRVLNVLKTSKTCWQEESGSVLRDWKWRTNICRVGSLRLPAIRRGSQVFIQYVQLATKVSAWCATFLSKQAEESKSKGTWQDVLSKLLSETNSFFLVTYTVASECSFLMEKRVISSVSSLISESLGLVKVLGLSSRAPRNEPQGAEMLKTAVDLLQAALRVVSIMNQTVTSVNNGLPIDGTPEALQIIISAMRDLQELGTLTARLEWGRTQSSGLKNIALLNFSWRSCVTILTISEESRTIVAPVVDIKNLMTRLISFGTYSLKRAVEEWLSIPSRELDIIDFRKYCVLVKFFTSQASKLCIFYPELAIALKSTVADFILKFATLLLGHNFETLPKEAIKLLYEVAAPSAFGLLSSLLGASGLHTNLKIELLQSVCSGYEPFPAIEDLGLGAEEPEWNFSLPVWNNSAQGGYLLSRVMVFLQLLEGSENYGQNLMMEFAKRLDWVVDSIAEDEVYAALLQVQIFPAFPLESKKKAQSQLMYLWVVKSLEKFIIRAFDYSVVRVEVQEFLFYYALHPNVLCGELIKHLWRFIAEQSDERLFKEHISVLVSLLHSVVGAEDPQAMKRLAQLICSLVQVVPSVGASHLFSLVFQEDTFATQSSSKIVSVLLQQGFNLEFLPEATRESSILAFLKNCLDAAKQSSESKGSPDEKTQDSMWCLLHLLNQCEDYIESKQRQEIKSLTFDSFLKNSRTMSDIHRFSGPVLSPILLIASFFLKQNVQPKALQNLLGKVEKLVKSALKDDYVAFKSSIAEFLSSLSAFEFSEEVGNPESEALWYLYHTVLREQHWALVHSGLTSFGHFAEQTPCNELWRFVPIDPGLASDVHESSQSGSDMFMSTLKAYLEKETMCASLTVLDADVEVLSQEARKQRSSCFHLLQQKKQEIPEEKTKVVCLDFKDVDRRPSKTLGLIGKSKPVEVETAILMLQEGFSLLSNISPEWLTRSDAKLEEWRSVISQLAVVNKKLSFL
ncbi:hypothetical protein KC19_VG055600 [Ceratodon purpureus]|uniref:Uncharacterized protein n=1 Tax=Ceratodon purpureus TaxID=3225 RepID=A0A8T0HM95_CERPU|nr:hypothetical protein KC19_VG055600 [Ceratodon purpureus]